MNARLASMLLLMTAACSEGDAADCDVAPSPSGPSDATTVTVGVFQSGDGQCFTDTGRTLTIQIGVSCGTWSRDAQADNHSSETHLHFNASDDTSYDGTAVAWTEYGPELSQADIDATCAGGANGVPKTASWTDYTVDKNIYLRIITAQ